MNARSSLLLVAFALALEGCPAKGKAPPEPGPMARAKFTPPGRCFGKKSRCATDAQCAPPFSTCQEGTCCSGVLDPETCTCRCAGGPPCSDGEMCCTGGDGKRDAGKLECRPMKECYGPL